MGLIFYLEYKLNPHLASFATRMLEQCVCNSQKPWQRSTEVSMPIAIGINPIVAVIPFAAQALQRWQKWYLSG